MFKSKKEMELEWGRPQDEVFELRYREYEKRRKKNLWKVMKERQRIIEEKEDDPEKKLRLAIKKE